MGYLAVALVACAVVMSGAYVYAPVLRVHAARQFRLPLPAGAVAAAAEPVAAPTPELPPRLLERVSQESEAWFRDELTMRARQLYAEFGDWDTVIAELERV